MTVKAYDMNILLGVYKESLKRKSVDCQGYTWTETKIKIDNPLQGKPSFPPAVCLFITKASLFKRNSFAKCYQCRQQLTRHRNTNHANYWPYSSSRRKWDGKDDIFLFKSYRGWDCSLWRHQPSTSKCMWTNWTFPLQDFFFHQAYTGCSNISDEGKIVMNGQHLVRYASHARVKFPKHISLAISAKHLTGSKQLITVLNKMDHCSSYE